MSKLIKLFKSLEEAGKLLEEDGEVDTSDTLCIINSLVEYPDALIKETDCNFQTIWEHGFSPQHLSTAFSTSFTSASNHQALSLALVYTSSIIASGAPVLGIFNRPTASSLLTLLRDLANGRRSQHTSKTNQHQISDISDEDEEDLFNEDVLFSQSKKKKERSTRKTQPSSSSSSTITPSTISSSISTIATNLAHLFTTFSLRQHPDILRDVVDTFSQLTRLLPDNATSTTSNNTISCCFQVLATLLSSSSIHGDEQEIAALVFHSMTPALLGIGKIKNNRNGANNNSNGAARSASLSFIKSTLTTTPPPSSSSLSNNNMYLYKALSSLSRYILLKVPDKADARAVAVESAVSLVSYMAHDDDDDHEEEEGGDTTNSTGNSSSNECDQYGGFVLFIATLASSDKTAQRMIAIETAAQLVLSSSVAMKHPWRDESTSIGATVLSILAQRCMDKSPAIRSKSLSSLASIITQYNNTNKSDEREGFRRALATCLNIGLRQQVVVGDDDDVQHTTHTNSINSGRWEFYLKQQQQVVDTSMSLSALKNVARRRSVDDKGTVRRAGLTLLEALHLFDSTYDAPSLLCILKADIEVIKAGINDPLVTVRRAAVSAAYSLFSASSSSSSSSPNRHLAVLWLQSGLLLVKDVELSLQELVLGQLTELVLDNLAVIGSSHMNNNNTNANTTNDTSGSDSATIASACRTVVPLLENIYQGGAPTKHSISTALYQLVSMKKVVDECQGRKIAAGLEAIITALVMRTEEGGGDGVDDEKQEQDPIEVVVQTVKQALAGLTSSQSNVNSVSTATAATTTVHRDIVRGAWLLYGELATFLPASPSWPFLYNQWKTASSSPSPSSFSMCSPPEAVLKVMASSSSSSGRGGSQDCSTKEQQQEETMTLIDSLKKSLIAMELTPSLAGAHIAALAHLAEIQSDNNNTSNNNMGVWFKEVMHAAEVVLGRYVQNAGIGSININNNGGESSSSSSSAAAATDAADVAATTMMMSRYDTRAMCAAYVAGEVSLLKDSACKASSRLVLYIEALTSTSLACHHPHIDDYNDYDDYDQAQQQPSLPSSSSSVPSPVQAHAWTSLGKLCLTDEPLAKKCVPLFIQQLGKAASPAVRNNILISLSDLVVHYTALVDAHFTPQLAARIVHDPNEVVRRQALALLANLLQKDYLKWRGGLFMKMVLALVDESPQVVEMAEYVLFVCGGNGGGNTSSSKAAHLVYNNFVEVMFALNDCQYKVAATTNGVEKGTTNNSSTSGTSSGTIAADRKGYTLKGPTMRQKRDAIYTILLKQMLPEHKFATSARLCQEVLGGVADGTLPLTTTTGNNNNNSTVVSEVLGDAFRVLVSPHIKVNPPPGGNGGGGGGQVDGSSSSSTGEEEEATAASALGAAKGRLVGAMMKKHLLEAVIPVIIQLRRVLGEARHPLLGELISTAAVLLKDYKGQQLENILSGDTQLAKEVMYDIKRAEEEGTNSIGEKDKEEGSSVSRRRSMMMIEEGSSEETGIIIVGTNPKTTPIAIEVLSTAKKQQSSNEEENDENQQGNESVALLGDVDVLPGRRSNEHCRSLVYFDRGVLIDEC